MSSDLKELVKDFGQCYSLLTFVDNSIDDSGSKYIYSRKVVQIPSKTGNRLEISFSEGLDSLTGQSWGQ